MIDDRVSPAGGIADISDEPAARLVERHLKPRAWTATWLDPPFRPEPPDVTQAYAICFVPDRRIVLIRVALDDGSPYWNLPGGGVKPGETLEDCLHREVMEEACARINTPTYLGCQRVDDPHHPYGPWRYYQARFCAEVELQPWHPQHETLERRLVAPEQFLATLSWGDAATARLILEEGLRLSGRFG
ncbi:MAG: NUDIX domain-containing protein [Acidimicrobiaceae bacterium]|nr:NUDIX domain-containing protein [Acidimicrobiaceae bacterium]